jgi:hypothetical protein
VNLIQRLRSALGQYPATPPEGVVAIMADGRVIPLELVYEGKEKGMHVWRATFPLPALSGELKIALLPAATTIKLNVEP